LELTALAVSIEKLYDTFSGYRLRAFSPCPTCYPEADVLRIERQMRTVPLRELTLDELSHFYSDGMLTWGDVDDFRHLLPRLMELFAGYYLDEAPVWSGDDRSLEMALDPDLAMLRFADGKWSGWPAAERAAVDEFLFALWSAFLGVPHQQEVELGHWVDTGLLAALLRLVPDPRRYLAHWRASGWPEIRYLAWFIANDELSRWFIWEDHQGRSTSASWELIRAWLDEPATVAQLERAARIEAPRASAWEAVYGLEVLQRGRRAVTVDTGVWLPDQHSIERAASLGVVLPDLTDWEARLLARIERRRESRPESHR